MHKIKVKTNKRNGITSFELNVDVLKNDRLYNICALFGVKKIYIDVYGINESSVSFMKSSIVDNIKLSNCKSFFNNCISIHTPTESISDIASLLNVIEFEELNIWDEYTNWEQHLIDNQQLTFQKNTISNCGNPTFYVNYNVFENNRLEMICNYGESKELLRKLQYVLRK